MLEKHILFCYKICNLMFYKRLNYKKKSIKWFLNKLIVKILYVYYSKLLEIFYGAYIHYKAKIGKNIKFNHSLHGIYISENAEIGDNCIILHHTTIGSNQPISGDAPKIGNNVFIGVNCCIIGKTVIGDNCIIGAGVVIANSIIPSDMTVVGQKFRMFRNKNRINK
jgi:serine O-acetyltransferase